MDKIEILHILTESTRFRLIELLFEHHYCVQALSKKLNISESAVSQHMRVLKKYGIVFGIKKGYQMHYRVDKDQITSILGEVLQQMAQYTAGMELKEECSCEYVSECIKRDTKISEGSKRGK